MNQAEHLKCPCKECGNNIEFPPSIVRTTISCPHCGQWTELLVPGTAEEETSGGNGIGLITLIAGAVVIIAVIAGAFFWMQHHASKSLVVNAASIKKIVAKPAPKTIPSPVPNPTNIPAEIIQAPPAKPREKSLDDLKAGEVTLEKTKGSSLVYAVGTLANDSDYQRFGVKVEFALFNAKGKKIAATQDYKDIIEPHKTWSFHALIPDSKTAAAKIITIKED